MSFAEDSALALGGTAVMLLVAALLIDRWRRRVILGRLGDQPALRRMMASASPGRRVVKAGLLVVAAVLLVIAAARPQVAGTWRPNGIDLAIALDVSKSMLVADVAPNRLDRARREVAALVATLDNDRVATVVFAGAAAHFPLTNDREVALHFALELGPADVPPGSDLREALRVSRCLLRPDVYDDLDCERIGGRGRGGEPLPGEPPIAADPDPPDPAARPAGGDPWGDEPPPPDAPGVKDERGKAILVFTDGGDQELAMHEVERARALGIDVYFVGVGTAEGGDVPEIDDAGKPSGVKRDRAGLPVVSKLDDEGLRALASAAGGEERYRVLTGDAPDPRALKQLLERVKRGDLERTDVEHKREVFHWFLFPALMLLVIEACVGDRKRRRYPEVS